MTRLGYQIPNFTYPGIAHADIFGNVVAQAKAAEAARRLFARLDDLPEVVARPWREGRS